MPPSTIRWSKVRLSHIFWRGQMYNNRPASQVTTRAGATALSIEAVGQGIVTRGVLLDLPKLMGKEWLEPGEAIFPEDLEAAEQAAGVRVESGDALFVRTGHQMRRSRLGPAPISQGRRSPSRLRPPRSSPIPVS